MNICGLELTGTQWAAIGSFAFAVASEVIGRSKLKENSVIDVAMSLLGQRIRPTDTPKISQTQSRPTSSSAKSRSSTRRRSSKSSSSSAQ